MSQDNEIREVIVNVKKLKSMADLNPEDYAERNGWADTIVQKTKIKATQLRKIFHYIKDLRREFNRSETGFNRAKVAMIMPSLAYAKGRGHIPEDMYELLTLCFSQDKCKSKEDFDSAVNFLEAIMAYHKFYHPKD
jgi:CRISPR type III-A-associated protein Csm2